MSNQKEREKHKPKYEEFVDDGLSDMKNSDPPSENRKKNKIDYEGRSLKDLRREARERGVTGYGTMGREQLIETLRRM